MNKPKLKVRAGSISATVWENEADIKGAKVKVNNVTLEKNYKDKDDKWQTTNSYGLHDLPKVIWVLTDVYKKLVINEEQQD